MGLGISKQQLRMVAVLLSGTLIAVLNMTLLTPALPTIMNDMGVNQTTVQWLTSGYALVEAVVIPLAAYMIGRFSTRRLFIGGILLFAAGSLTAALAPVFWVILAGRMMQAAATGIIMPMVSSIILLVFPREKRGSAMGIVGLIIGFAPAIGPSLSGLVVDHIGWRALFGIVTTLALVIAFTASRILVNFDNFKRTKFDAPSVVLSTLGLLSLLYGFSTFSSAENHAVTAALIVVGAALIGVYARRQLTLDTPMLHLDILHVRQYRTVVCIIAIFQAALVGMETIMPLYIQGVLGHSATVSGLTLLPGPVIGAVVGVLAGRLFDRDGVRRPVLAGSIFLIAGAVGLFMLRIDTPVPLVAVAYALISVGMQFTMTPMNTWGVNSLPNSKVSHAQSTSNTVNQVGTSFGTAILVSISAAVSGVVGSSEAGAALSATEVTFVGYHAAFAGTAALLIVALVCIYVFVRDKKGEARKATQSNADGASGAEGAPTGTDAYAEIAANAGIASAENASTGERPTEGAATSASPAAPDFPASPTAPDLPASPTVADAMNPHAAQVPVSASMREVVALMAETETSGVAVVADDGTLAGFVSDGDVARYLGRNNMEFTSSNLGVANFRDDDTLREKLAELVELNVMRIAVERVVSVEQDVALDDACTMLAKRKIKKMPVTCDGRVVGSISRRNVMRYLMREMGK